MPRRFPHRKDVRAGRGHPRQPGTYQTRPMRPVSAGSEEPSDEDHPNESAGATGIEHKGSGWYLVRLGGEVIEESVRGKEQAEQVLNEALSE